MTKQLNKLINVLKIVELAPAAVGAPRVAVDQARADAAVRGRSVTIVEMFRAHIVDVAPDSLTVEATGTSDKLEALVRMLEPFGVRELVQSGMVALGRGPRAITTDRGAPIGPAGLNLHRRPPSEC